MKCKYCVTEYLEKTRKLLDIKEIFIVTEGNSYCSFHWFKHYTYIHSESYIKNQMERHMSENQNASFGLYQQRYQPMQSPKVLYSIFGSWF